MKMAKLLEEKWVQIKKRGYDSMYDKQRVYELKKMTVKVKTMVIISYVGGVCLTWLLFELFSLNNGIGSGILFFVGMFWLLHCETYIDGLNENKTLNSYSPVTREDRVNKTSETIFSDEEE